MRNAARESARRARARADHEGGASRAGSVPSDTELVERAELQRVLVEQVLALEPLYRRAILMRFFEGVPTAEIARRDGVTQSTARTRLRRGLQKLRVSLGRKRGGDWRLALLPLLPKGGSAAPIGAWIVGTKSALVAVAGVAALVLGFLWWDAWREGPALSKGEAQVASSSSVVDEADVANVLESAGSAQGDAPRAEATPANPVRTRRLRIVRDEDGVPLPGAEVDFVSVARLEEWSRERGLNMRYASPYVSAVGESHTANESGFVELPVTSGECWVAGVKDAYFAARRLSPDDGVTELRLALDPPLRIVVSDSEGRRLPWVSVGLFRSDHRSSSGDPLMKTLTDRSGNAELHPRREGLSVDSQYRVGLAFPLASPVEAHVDLREPPDQPIHLVAPATGRVRVVLVGDDAASWPDEVDLSLQAMVPSKTDPSRMVRADQRDYRRLQGIHELVFEQVAVGVEVHLFVYRDGKRKPIAINRPGPREPGDEVVIRVPFPERYAWVQGRFAREDGLQVPASSSVFAQDLDSGVGRIDITRLAVESDGGFSLALQDRTPAGVRCRVAVVTRPRTTPPLGAAFHFLAPASGQGIDVGRVVLREAPLIVGGVVTDGAGEPLESAWLQLGNQYHQPDGSFDWHFMGFGGVTTDEYGRFEFRGDLLPYAYAVHAQERGYDRVWTPFELGQSDLEVVLTSHGGLEGHLRVPPEFPVERLAVAARPCSGDAPQWWSDLERRCWVRHDGGFEIPNLAPGIHEVAVLTGKYSNPLAILGQVEITGRGRLAPESMADVDLTSLKVIDIEVSEPGGDTADGYIAVGSGEGRRLYRLRNGAVSIITAEPTLDVTVHGAGCRPLRLPNLRASTRVTVEPGIPVTVTLPADFPITEDPIFLNITLAKVEDEGSGWDGYVYSQDSRDRQHIVSVSRDLSARLTFDDARTVTLGAPQPGRYSLDWRLVRMPETALDGRATWSIRWKERDAFLQVDEAGVELLTHPLRSNYDEALEDARAGVR